MKYIDADKLIAEIEKLLAKAKNDEVKAFAKKDAAGHLIAVTKTAVCVKIKKLIASLQQEQPEVDLEKDEFVGVAESPLKTFPRVNDFECGSSYRH